ncbi:MAG: hypothetical protein ACLPSF_05185 [Methylocella sp.]
MIDFARHAGDVAFFMIRFALQLAGLFILAGAVAALAIDASRSFAAGRLIVTQISETAAALAPAKMAMLRAALGPHLHPPLDQIFTIIARSPTFLAFGALGLLALRLARKPAPKIGYSSR